MGFKIGFTTNEEKNEKNGFFTRITEEKRETRAPRKSVVEVHFPSRSLTCTYYNDAFDLKKGDIVYVDGKLEGLRGRVVNINYTFKIKLSDYKRIIGVADTSVAGEFFLAGSHFITKDSSALGYEKVRTWFCAPTNEEEFAFGEGDEVFNLHDLTGMRIDNSTAERGHEYYTQNRVAYFELDNGRGRAIVVGTKPYEIEFYIDDKMDVYGLICNCYCTGACKHEFAAMLQIRETLDFIAENYSQINPNKYLAAVSKAVFIENAIGTKDIGGFIFA